VDKKEKDLTKPERNKLKKAKEKAARIRNNKVGICKVCKARLGAKGVTARKVLIEKKKDYICSKCFDKMKADQLKKKEVTK